MRLSFGSNKANHLFWENFGVNWSETEWNLKCDLPTDGAALDALSPKILFKNQFPIFIKDNTLKIL